MTLKVTSKGRLGVDVDKKSRVKMLKVYTFAQLSIHSGHGVVEMLEYKYATLRGLDMYSCDC